MEFWADPTGAPDCRLGWWSIVSSISDQAETAYTAAYMMVSGICVPDTESELALACVSAGAFAVAPAPAFVPVPVPVPAFVPAAFVPEVVP